MAEVLRSVGEWCDARGERARLQNIISVVDAVQKEAFRGALEEREAAAKLKAAVSLAAPQRASEEENAGEQQMSDADRVEREPLPELPLPQIPGMLKENSGKEKISRNFPDFKNLPENVRNSIITLISLPNVVAAPLHTFPPPPDVVGITLSGLLSRMLQPAVVSSSISFLHATHMTRTSANDVQILSVFVSLGRSLDHADTPHALSTGIQQWRGNRATAPHARDGCAQCPRRRGIQGRNHDGKRYFDGG